jgi:CheY-like chemotaxis protein
VAFDGSQRQRVRVLIVDDSDGTARRPRPFLKKPASTRSRRPTGLEDVIVAHYALPAVVLMDLTMPCSTGWKPAAPETIIARVQRFVTPDRLAVVASEGPAA